MNTQDNKKIPYLAYAVLPIGLMAVSAAAIFIRLAQAENAPSLVIAAGRLAIASVILTPPVWYYYREDLKSLTRRDILLAMLSGLMLGFHFATWITSLEYTSVIASVVLVTTNPIFVVLLSWPLLGEKVDRRVIIEVGLAIVGGLLVAASGDAGTPPTRPDPLLGNALATIGALAVAFYMMIGRRLRDKLHVMPYIWLVYTTAAVFLVLVTLISGNSFTGYGQAYLWIFLMALIPQLVGHTAFNYALGHLPAAYVSLVVLGEPAGSTLLAMLFLDEWPARLAVVGSAVILSGIAIATLSGSDNHRETDILVEESIP